MSENNNNTAEKSDFAKIVKRVMDRLELTDDGKVIAYYKGEVKNLQGKIAKIDINRQARELNFKHDSAAIVESIEDAKVALSDAFQAVDPKSVATSEARTNFRKTFWEGIAEKESALTELEESLETLTEKNTKAAKAENVLVGQFESYIETLKS